MKAKTKLIMSIMSVCLVCAVFAIGVFALRTANLKIGGDVSFSATGVEVDIKNATLTGATTNDQVLAIGSINTTMTQTDIDSTFQNWQTLELDFNENADDIELKFDIANTSTNANNYIEIDYDYSFTTANPNVDVFPGDENAQGVWENNNYILTPKGSAETATYETFTLKFKVLDKELNVPENTKVNLTIALKHTTPVVGTVEENKLTTPDGIIYTVNANGTACLGSTIEITEDNYTIAEGDNYSYDGDADVIIAPVVSDGTKNYIVTVIERCAFSYIDEESYNEDGNEVMETIHIPNSVKEIKACAFVCCYELVSANIPKSVTAIEISVFRNTLLSEIGIPSSVTSIEGWAFCECDGLTTITIPSSVTSIGYRAFNVCTGLTSITIPSSVTNIGSVAFTGTAWYNNQPDGLIYINNVLYEYKGTMPAGTSIEVKEGIVSISDYAFYNCSGLTSITIPSGVTSIEDSAFYGCTGLTSITIPSGVTSIGDFAFDGCTGLTSITIPSSVTSIGISAFFGCSSLTSITIPSGVTSIGSNAFSRCESLTSVKFEEISGWSVSDSANGTRTPIAESEFTADASEDNANLLKTTYCNKYWIRTVE